MLGVRKLARSVLLGILTVWFAALNCVYAQEVDWEKREQQLKQAQKELGEIKRKLAFEPGDEAVVLRDASLKVGRETVGSVRRSKKLKIQKVQGQWLWVVSDGTKGWIDQRRVMDAKLFDWYRRLPNDEHVTVGDRMGGKYKDILFEVIGQGGANSFIDSPIQMGGRVASHPVMVIGKNATFVLDRQGPQWLLSVTFMRLSDVFSNDTPVVVNAARRYGAVRPGDFVQIDVKQRRVYVDGQLRGPRSR